MSEQVPIVTDCTVLEEEMQRNKTTYPPSSVGDEQQICIQSNILQESDVVFRKLGNTGHDVSSVGFGTWQLGGGRWQSGSSKQCIDLLRQARDLGINIFDAAVVYGQYTDQHNTVQSRSQELLGKAFENDRSKVIYCVKVGQFDEYSHRSDYDTRRIVGHVVDSMRRLKTDYLDICLIHAPSLADVQRGVAIEILRTLQTLGMIRSVGYSFEAEPAHVAAAINQRIDVVMLQYNLIDRQCGELLNVLQSHGVGVLVGGPFKRGYLSGRFRHISDLTLDDDYWRWNLAYNQGKVEQILSHVRTLMPPNGEPTELRRRALRFVLHEPGVSSAIVGHRSIKEVIENIRHASI